MARGIVLEWAMSHYNVGQETGVRVRIDAVCAEDMPADIFAYRMMPVDPGLGESAGFYSHICSPPDLEEFPVDEPRVGHAPQWFRLSFVDVLVRSLEEAETFINRTRRSVRILKRTLDRMDTLIPAGRMVFGDDCAPAPESSSSSSSSVGASIALGPPQAQGETGHGDQSAGSGVAWTLAGEGAGSPVGLSDSSGGSLAAGRSIVALSPGESSQLLLIRGFVFSDLPADAVIDGIEVGLTIRQPSGHAATLSLLAIQAPALGDGTNLAAGETIGAGWELLEFGDETELWGLDLGPEALQDGAFGVGVVVSNPFDSLPAVVEIDGAAVTVHYRTPE